MTKGAGPKMKEQTKQASDESAPGEEFNDAAPAGKRSGGSSMFIVGLMGMLVIYVLSVGPFVMLGRSGHLTNRWLEVAGTFYVPIEWAYEKTPLRKPLGLY